MLAPKLALLSLPLLLLLHCAPATSAAPDATAANNTTLTQCVLCDLLLNVVSFGKDAAQHPTVYGWAHTSAERLCRNAYNPLMGPEMVCLRRSKASTAVFQFQCRFMLGGAATADTPDPLSVVLKAVGESTDAFYELLAAQLVACPNLEKLGADCLRPPS